MGLEEAKKYIRMIIRQQEIPDSAKALGYVYASEAIETIIIGGIKLKNSTYYI